MVILPRRHPGWLPIFFKPDTLETGYPAGRGSEFRGRRGPTEFQILCRRRRPMQPTTDFNPKTATKKLLREGRSGALASLLPGSGDPYCSLVNIATAADAAPLLLLSTLALHTKNMLADNRVSLMLDERKDGDPLEGARVMLMGTAAATDDPAVRTAYL